MDERTKLLVRLTMDFEVKFSVGHQDGRETLFVASSLPVTPLPQNWVM